MSAISRLRKSLPKLEKEYQARLASGEHSAELDMMKKIIDQARATLAKDKKNFAKSAEK